MPLIWLFIQPIPTASNPLRNACEQTGKTEYLNYVFAYFSIKEHLSHSSGSLRNRLLETHAACLLTSDLRKKSLEGVKEAGVSRAGI